MTNQNDESSSNTEVLRPPAHSRPTSTVCTVGSQQHPKERQRTDMGDKSPKAAKKNASQKQAKSNQADQKKREEVAAKQAPAKKK